MKTIIFTGGGSGGHLAPIRAIAPELKKTKKLIWIGSSHFEKQAARDLHITFKSICSGKFRRGKNFKNLIKNFVDIFRVGCGIVQSFFILLKNKPEKIFSTGGFVSVPVVIAAWILRIPVIIHEQTIGFGLANRIAAPVAQKILLAFPESKKYIPKKYHYKIEVVGNPIREDLTKGSFENLQKFLGDNLNEEKPILYITGGGQGSQLINEVIFELLPELTQKYYVIHQTGKSGIEKAKICHSNILTNVRMTNGEKCDYFPFEFVGAELSDIYASADIVLARAGAGTVNELDYFGVPSIFVPLRLVHNDEQTKNAEWFLKKNSSVIARSGAKRNDEAISSQTKKVFGIIIPQHEFNKETFMNKLEMLSIAKFRRKIKIPSQKQNRAKELILRELI